MTDAAAGRIETATLPAGPSLLRRLLSHRGLVIGMTLVPEAPLARELGMYYSAIGVVTNYSTGMTSYVTDDGIGSVMCEMRDSVFDVCFDLIKNKTC